MRRASLVRAAAERVRARPQGAVSFLEIPSRHLPASLGKLAGREGWWFAYKFSFEALVPEERVAHLVLWFDGARFQALSDEEARAFAVLPADESRSGPRGATASLGAAQEDALQSLRARLRADVEVRSQAAFDESRERWDRTVEDGLAPARRAADEARAAWTRARSALHEQGLTLRERRALLERAEREFRRRLEDLRATEAQRYAERDRAIAELRRRAEPRESRSLVATAYWRCP